MKTRQIFLLFLVLFCLDHFSANAERFTGTLKLNSANTEQTIGKYGVRRTGDISVKLSTAKTGWERGRHKLKVLLFEDKSYEEYDRQLKKGSLCDSRCNLANLEHEVDLPHPKATHKAEGYEFFEDPESGDCLQSGFGQRERQLGTSRESHGGRRSYSKSRAK